MLLVRTSALVAVILGSLALGAASGLRAAEPVVFHAGWFASPQLAGVYVALERGFYRAAGLDVRIEPFAFGINSPARIDATPEVAALGTIEGYIFLQKRDAGVDLQALAAMLQESPAGYMSLKATGVRSIRDFPGKRVGVHHFAEALYAWFLNQAAISPESAKMIVVQDDVTLLTRGELDVMQGYATEEFVRLRAMTQGDGQFLSFAELGFSSYSEMLYTTGAQAKRHSATLKAFVAATRRGWIEAFAHPQETVAILAQHLGKDADREHLAAALAAIKPYVIPAGKSPLAPMTEEKWHALQKTSTGVGLIKRSESVEDFLLNW